MTALRTEWRASYFGAYCPCHERFTAVLFWLDRDRKEQRAVFSDWSPSGATRLAYNLVKRLHSAGNLNGYRIQHRSWVKPLNSMEGLA